MPKELFMCDVDQRPCTETEGCSGTLEDCKHRLEFIDFKRSGLSTSTQEVIQ